MCARSRANARGAAVHSHTDALSREHTFTQSHIEHTDCDHCRVQRSLGSSLSRPPPSTTYPPFPSQAVSFLSLANFSPVFRPCHSRPLHRTLYAPFSFYSLDISLSATLLLPLPSFFETSLTLSFSLPLFFRCIVPPRSIQPARYLAVHLVLSFCPPISFPLDTTLPRVKLRARLLSFLLSPSFTRAQRCSVQSDSSAFANGECNVWGPPFSLHRRMGYRGTIMDLFADRALSFEDRNFHGSRRGSNGFARFPRAKNSFAETNRAAAGAIGRDFCGSRRPQAPRFVVVFSREIKGHREAYLPERPRFVSPGTFDARRPLIVLTSNKILSKGDGNAASRRARIVLRANTVESESLGTRYVYVYIHPGTRARMWAQKYGRSTSRIREDATDASMRIYRLECPVQLYRS